jgi:DNA-binding transcriptional LysR family regulator
MGTNLELLRTFVDAASAPSLGAAAERRHVTKSAVSQQLKTLEAQLGVRLFERVGRHVRPTETARALADALGRAFALVDDALEIAKDRDAVVRGTLRVGAPRPFARVWLRPRLAALLEAHRDLTLDVVFGVPSDLERRLLAGELDLAVLSRPADAPALETATLFVETFTAVASPAYLRARGLPKTEADLDAHRFIVFAPDLPMHAAWWRMAVGRSTTRRATIACTVRSLDEMLGLAALGAGVAVLPDYFVADALRAKEVVVVPPPARPGARAAAKNPIVLAWRRGAVASARLRAARDVLLRADP